MSTENFTKAFNSKMTEVLLATVGAAVLALGGWVFSQSNAVAVLDAKVSHHEKLMPDVSAIKASIESLREEQRRGQEHIRELLDIKSRNLELLIEQKLK